MHTSLHTPHSTRRSDAGTARALTEDGGGGSGVGGNRAETAQSARGYAAREVRDLSQCRNPSDKSVAEGLSVARSRWGLK
eukprot:2762557-Rhodomonas_salina.3